LGQEEANCLAFERDEKAGAMSGEHAWPRGRVVEIVERRRDNYPWPNLYRLATSRTYV